MLHVGLIGYGYWGPNLARNFSKNQQCRLVAICEKKPDRARAAAADYPHLAVLDDAASLIAHPQVEAVAIATPVAGHYPLAKAALSAGKHVLVEKPLTETSAQARELIELAARKNLVLAVDHTFLYSGAVRKIKELVTSGQFGDFLYIDSVRINLGLFQQDVNVLYDLAPHDLSIVGHLLDENPATVRAMGACHARACQENIVYLHLEYPDGLLAHFHLSWLAPVKIRKTILAGTKRMIVYDDLDQSEKVKVYDEGIDVARDAESLYNIKIAYRTGDMFAPRVSSQEPLALEVDNFRGCVRGEQRCMSSGEDGFAVVRILEAAQKSLRSNGTKIRLNWD